MCVTLKNQRMEQCCCGCTVKTGSMILGILDIIGAIAQLASASLSMDYSQFGPHIASGIISIIISICLIHGVHKGKKYFLLPWLVIRGIAIICLPIIVFILFILALVYEAYLLIIFVVGILLMAALAYYFWKCVWSFYLDLSDAEMLQTTQA